MIHFITYSNKSYEKSRNYCVKMAKKKGKVDTITAYKPKDIDKVFWNKNRDVMETKVGNGLWLWKPYFLLKKMQDVNWGDIVLYCDAGSFFFRNCRELVESMHDDIWVSNIPLIEKQYTKPELFEIMGCTSAKYKDTNQVQANFIMVRKTKRSIKFVEEWLYWCTKKNTLTRDTAYSGSKLKFTYFEHRSDQSVLSILTKKWDIEAHRDPSQYGRVPEKYYASGRIFKYTENGDKYKPCIILHRRKYPEIKTCLSQWLITWLPLSVIHRLSKACRIFAHDYR